MFLSIDIGNTNITLGVFEQENLLETFRLPSNKDLSQKEYEVLLKNLCQNYIINECIIGSVVEELSFVIKKACDNVFKIETFLFKNNFDYGMKILLEKPEEVGADRIANAIGAREKYPLPAIIVDIGTATTFDIVSKEGNFIGGVIMPGLNLQFKALSSNTSKLPKIEANYSEKAIGKSTQKAMLSGIMRGSACAIEGLIHQCELELGEKATIIATGGHSKLISEYMFRRFDYIDSLLTLEGLRLLYKMSKTSAFASKG